jgi:uncharacterized protein
VLAEGESIALLLIGTGRDVAFVAERIRARLREGGVSVDVMQTGAAARTYNILLGENRRVGAALIAVV